MARRSGKTAHNLPAKCKALPDSQRNGGASASRVVDEEITEITQMFLGPLPPPAVLQKYEELQPGAAKEIIGWVTCEQKSRHLENLVGKIFALVYGLAVCGVAVFAIYKNYPKAASIVIGLNVAAVCLAAFAVRPAGQRPPEQKKN